MAVGISKLSTRGIILSFLITLLLNSSPGVALTHAKPRLQILGLGQFGSALADAAKDTFQVCGTVRDTGKQWNGGIEEVIFSPKKLEDLFPSCSCVLVTIPPPKEESQRDDLNKLYDDMVYLLPEKSWIGVVSTTGVYGHHEGKLVDEESDLLGQGESATRFQEFEAEWQSRLRKADGKLHTLNIFRCAGIYGPDRSMLHTLYKRGLPSSSKKTKSEGVTNRIHVDDIAQAVVAAMLLDLKKRDAANKEALVRVFNLADDLPESRQTVMHYAVDLFASIDIPLESMKASPPSASGRASRRSSELKLVSNKRMKEELLPTRGLRYPTYAGGLKSILMLPQTPWHEQKHAPQNEP